MKTARTLRTLRRTNTDPKTVGFLGVPTGKRVRTLAKRHAAMRRLAMLAGTPAFQRFTRVGSEIQSIKALTRFLKSGPEVQAAWLK